MKKVIIVNASPRKNGNCAAVASHLAEKLEDTEVKRFDITSSSVGFCKACGACKKKETVWCVQNDDMAALLPEIDACDALVMLAPIYMGEPCAQAMAFMNRLYAFSRMGDPSAPGVATRNDKKVAAIVTSGAPGDMYLAKAQMLAERGFLRAGFPENRALAFGLLNEPGSVVEHEEYMQQVDELAAWLVS